MFRHVHRTTSLRPLQPPNTSALQVCDALQPARDGGYRAEGAAKARDAVQCWRERLSKQKDGRDTPMGDGHVCGCGTDRGALYGDMGEQNATQLTSS